MDKIKNISIRKILNSVGNFAYEAVVELQDGSTGIASAPAAILPGIRERKVTMEKFSAEVIEKLKGNFYTQKTLDDYLEMHINAIGSDVTLSISMAFARAVCSSEKISLVNYIRNLVNCKRENKCLAPLVPIFSGGVHDYSLGGSMQQIMIKVFDMNFKDTVQAILILYNQIEKFLINKDYVKGISASSGFLVKGLNIDDEFEIISEMLDKSIWKENISIAVDVAAEHLRVQKGYRFYGKVYSPAEFESLLMSYLKKYPISFLEDPFDFRDADIWKQLYRQLRKNVEVFSDDYSATQIKYLNSSLADGVIVKMKQVGTLSSTLMLISEMKRMQLKSCVSHRSIETEDTFICDLAVAVNADYMKIGGPRRGDRIEKYNRLIRLYDVKF